MAEVWSATHQPSGVDVALKLIRKLSADPHDVDREVAAMARLDHPGIVRIFDYGHTDEGITALSEGRVPTGATYIAMELANGGALAERQRPRSFLDLRSLVEQVGEGLAHAHSRGIVHRASSPRTCWCSKNPAGGR
jgi:eukaryotic-like serine/threonine-protein kinase